MHENFVHKQGRWMNATASQDLIVAAANNTPSGVSRTDISVNIGFRTIRQHPGIFWKDVPTTIAPAPITANP